MGNRVDQKQMSGYHYHFFFAHVNVSKTLSKYTSETIQWQRSVPIALLTEVEQAESRSSRQSLRSLTVFLTVRTVETREAAVKKSHSSKGQYMHLHSTQFNNYR